MRLFLWGLVFVCLIGALYLVINRLSYQQKEFACIGKSRSVTSSVDEANEDTGRLRLREYAWWAWWTEADAWAIFVSERTNYYAFSNLEQVGDGPGSYYRPVPGSPEPVKFDFKTASGEFSYSDAHQAFEGECLPIHVRETKTFPAK